MSDIALAIQTFAEYCQFLGFSVKIIAKVALKG